MTIYRRRRGSDTWHFTPDCRWWHMSPTAVFSERARKPTTGELCNACMAKARRG